MTITGITGFLGAHILNLFLQDGSYIVRGTVRDAKNSSKFDLMKKALGSNFEKVEVVEANLNDPESVDKAIEGSTYVIHQASPLPMG